MNMKRIIAAAALLAVLSSLFCLAGCVKPAEVGAKLSDNIARLWFPGERESRFVLNSQPIEGSVTGQAFLDPASNGKTAIAWVDVTPYFISEKGVDKLTDATSAAVISFDGSCAVYQAGEQLMLFSAETRSASVIAEGVASVQQISVSPASKAVAFTAQFSDSGAERRSMIYKDGSLTPILEGKDAIVMAVSDDASLCYYYDFGEATVYAEQNGEKTVVTTKPSLKTNFNFTRDLSEVAFCDSEDVNHLFRLSDKQTFDLGEGFQYTLKTDIYSVSATNVITYINDVDSFENGLWLKRDTIDGVRVYAVGLINGKGELNWLAENVGSYASTNDGKRVLSLGGGKLVSTDMKGKSRELAADVASFAITDDGSFTYYISSAGTLFGIEGTGKPVKLASNASSVKVSGGVCFCLTDVTGDGDAACGTLKTFRGLEASADIAKNVSSFDRRNGHVIVYVLPEDGSGKPIVETAEDGAVLLNAWFTYDGGDMKLLGEKVEK